MYVDFEVLEVVFGDVIDVVLQLLQTDQLCVGDHASLLIHTPHDTSGETNTHNIRFHISTVTYEHGRYVQTIHLDREGNISNV